MGWSVMLKYCRVFVTSTLFYDILYSLVGISSSRPLPSRFDTDIIKLPPTKNTLYNMSLFQIITEAFHPSLKTPSTYLQIPTINSNPPSSIHDPLLGSHDIQCNESANEIDGTVGSKKTYRSTKNGAPIMVGPSVTRIGPGQARSKKEKNISQQLSSTIIRNPREDPMHAVALA